MRRIFAVLLVATIMVLTGCSQVEITETSSAQVTSTTEKVDREIYAGKVVTNKDGIISIAGNSGEFIRLELNGLELVGEGDEVVSVSDITEGTLVEIEYSGMIMETYPGKLYEPETLRVVGREDSVTGLYKNVFNDLYNTDPALNSDILMIAFDFTNVENMDDAEKEIFCWEISEEYGLEVVESTFDELCDEGYIDSENLYFEDGILVTLSDSEIDNGSFEFDIDKWRSGVGAYFLNNCVAEKSEDGWSYKVGSMAIS